MIVVKNKGKGEGKGNSRQGGEVAMWKGEKGGGLIEYIQTCFPREPYLLIGVGSRELEEGSRK